MTQQSEEGEAAVSSSSDKWWEHPERPCRGRTAEWFLEDVPHTLMDREVERLVALCQTCPVLGPCRAEATRSISSFSHGVQGGLSIKAQRKVRRRMKSC